MPDLKYNNFKQTVLALIAALAAFPYYKLTLVPAQPTRATPRWVAEKGTHSWIYVISSDNKCNLHIFTCHHQHQYITSSVRSCLYYDAPIMRSWTYLLFIESLQLYMMFLLLETWLQTFCWFQDFIFKMFLKYQTQKSVMPWRNCLIRFKVSSTTLIWYHIFRPRTTYVVSTAL